MANRPASRARAIRASDDLWKAVDSRAEKDNVSVSDVVRTAVVQYLGPDAEGLAPVTGREDGRPVRAGRAKARNADS